MLLCLGPILSRPLILDTRKKRLGCQCHWKLEKTSAYAGWVFPAQEVSFGVEGYDDDVDASRVKEDMEVFGRGVWSGLLCDCDLTA